VTTVATDNRSHKLRQARNAAILPLLIAFILLIIVKVFDFVY